ncbi:hypothetical protein [Clostridium sp.]|uniref:hypothetical protein n=1 Tax=Clostridium sp. TaxID=1506 RepID=UPI003217A27D
MGDYSSLFQMLGNTCTDGNTSPISSGFGGGKILIWIILFCIFCRGGSGFGFGGGCGGNTGSNCGCGGNSGNNNCCGCGGNCGNNCGCGGNWGNNCSCCDCCCCKERCCCCGGTIKGRRKEESYILDVIPNCCGNTNQCGNSGWGGNSGLCGFGGNWCIIILIIAIFFIRKDSPCKTEIC